MQKKLVGYCIRYRNHPDCMGVDAYFVETPSPAGVYVEKRTPLGLDNIKIMSKSEAEQLLRLTGIAAPPDHVHLPGEVIPVYFMWGFTT